MRLFKFKKSISTNNESNTTTQSIKSKPKLVSIYPTSISSNSSSISNNSIKKLSTSIKNFNIELHEPRSVYKTGDYLNGEAVLKITSDTVNIALRLSLICELKVKAGNTAASRTQISETLLNNEALLYGEDYKHLIATDSFYKNEIINGLTKGEHRFPFKVKIPVGKNPISSINFERGSISYRLECSFESINEFQKEKPIIKCQKDFLVVAPLDVSTLNEGRKKTVVLQSAAIPPLRHSNQNNSVNGSYNNNSNSSHSNSLSTKQVDDGTSSFITKITNNSSSTTSSNNSSNKSINSEKKVVISVNLPHSGFTIGEIIPIKVSINHYKEFSHPASLITTLVRICRVNGSGDDQLNETFRKDICQSVSPVYIDPVTLDCNLIVYLKVPLDAFATFTAVQKYFSFQYYVEVMVNLSQKNIIYTESNRIIGKPNENNQSNELIFQRLEDNMNHLQRNFFNKMNQNAIMNDHDDIESNILYHDMVNVDKLKRLRNVTGMSIEVIIGTTRNKTIDHEIESNNQTIKDYDIQDGNSTHTTTSNKYIGNSISLENTLSNGSNINNTSSLIQNPEPPPELSNPSSIIQQLPIHLQQQYQDYLQSYVANESSSINNSQATQALQLNAWLSSIHLQALNNPVPKYTPNNEINITEDKNELEQTRLKEMESDPPLADY
ncbi:hypothetical protein TBLA_0B09840 [Henningerozyma blattae CBS 6284]|uniref:pH-response regulator protein palF/RIM8 n=1 Tax=Henningerozyma blattae (strain ATCC 34711 / CBS 6284 / DSM 70876 / NBRC 10599 / NRRL Y-10934 / UCD 77-7) TaxID=1071380 RepID=I2H0A0_HENB6|nr:hypothetical protein TBLA_0B09840 [Tetrapisispora blattae CBS 6284]CCH59802.1 hypothetical protein TBLA_0B09840 [Tetrapisispora blattae CBS 6284]